MHVPYVKTNRPVCVCLLCADNNHSFIHPPSATPPSGGGTDARWHRTKGRVYTAWSPLHFLFSGGGGAGRGREGGKLCANVVQQRTDEMTFPFYTSFRTDTDVPVPVPQYYSTTQEVLHDDNGWSGSFVCFFDDVVLGVGLYIWHTFILKLKATF